jgi:hypothetical protein
MPTKKRTSKKTKPKAIRRPAAPVESLDSRTHKKRFDLLLDDALGINKK